MRPLSPGDGVAFDAATRVGAALRAMTAAFRLACHETAEIDARFLVQGVLEIDATALIRDPDRPLGAYAAALNDAVCRRLAHEPVSRILGAREFYGRRFEITPDVLDPRPETETLVDLALDIVNANGWRDQPITIADIGTGSGILIATLLAELPCANGIATDVSRAALAVAVANARRLGLAQERVRFIETRGLGTVPGSVHLIVSNPPYIPTAEIATLDPGVLAYDPRLALDGGADGLDIYREISNEIRLLEFNTWIALEVGARQADDVATIFSNNGARLHLQRPDLGGHIRAVAFEHRR